MPDTLREMVAKKLWRMYCDECGVEDNWHELDDEGRLDYRQRADAILAIFDAREAKLVGALEAITRIDDYEPDCNKSGDFLTARELARAALASVKEGK